MMFGMRLGLSAVSFLSVFLAGCTSAGSFACQDDTDCGEGACEATGYCSFPDTACETGRRYGDLAESGLAGQCVSLDAETETGATSTTEASSGTAGSSMPTTLEPGTSSTGEDGESSVDTLAPTAASGGSETSSGVAECGDGQAEPGEDCFDVEAFEDYPLRAFVTDIAAGDFDNNGTVGIAAVSNDEWGFGSAFGEFCFYAADGLGGYGAGECSDLESPAFRIHVLDGNGDGAFESIVLREDAVDTIHNIGGNQSVRSYDVSGTQYGISDLLTADFDGDGIADVLHSVAYGWNVRLGENIDNQWWLGDPSSPTGIVGEGAAGVAVVPGASVGDSAPWAAVFLNQYNPTVLGARWEDGSFNAPPVESPLAEFEACVGVASGSRHAAVADVDGDGVEELVVTCINGSFVVMRWTGGAFEPTVVTLAGAYRATPGDIDGDGDSELLVVSDSLGVAVLYDFDGKELVPRHQFAVVGLTSSAILHDLDGDGALDVAMAFTDDDEGLESAEGTLRVWHQAP